MPRQQTLQIESSQPLQQRGSQVGTQVSASPVDTYVDQGMNQRMSQLNSLLDSGHALLKTIDDGEAAEGAKDAALGKEQSPSLMGRALGSYERGWMTVRGSVSGAEDASKLLAEYQAGGFDPKNPQGLEGWLQQKFKEKAQGMPDGPFKSAYEGKLMEGFNDIRATHFKTQRDSVVAQSEADTITLLGGVIKQAAKDGKGLTPESFMDVRKKLSESGIGFDDKRWSELGQKALQAAALDGNVQAIDAAQAEAQDKSKAFSTLTEGDFAQLRHHAQTVLIQRTEQEHKALKLQYETRVNDALYPIMKQAMTDQAGAQKAFAELVMKTDLFKGHPEDFSKYQQMLIQTGDRALTVEERETENDMMTQVWSGKAGPKDIFAAHLPAKSTMNLMTVYMDKWKVERAAQATEAQARAMTNLFRNQEVAQDIRSGVEALPRWPSNPMAMENLTDSTNGRKYSQKVREIQAQTHADLFKAANDSQGDVAAFGKKRTAILEQARSHIERVLNDAAGGGKGGTAEVPPFVHYPSWESYRKAIEDGLVPMDPETIAANRAYFNSKKPKQTTK